VSYGEQLRIAFDGDAVFFSEESEVGTLFAFQIKRE